MTYRLTVKEVAQEFGIYATFMPKPIAGMNGSGMHTHQSLFEGDRNAFFDATDEYHLSKTAKAYIAGILRHAPEITLVTNQWVNSYKRLIPGSRRRCTSAGRGATARALVRVPHVQAGQGGRDAHRVPLAGPGLQPLPRVLRDAGGRPRGHRGRVRAAARGVEQHLRDDRATSATSPGSVRCPRTCTRRSGWPPTPRCSATRLGEHVHEFLIRNKRLEWDGYKAYVTPYETDRYLPIL